MVRARKPHTTAPEDAPRDLAAEHARLLLEVQRLRLEYKGLRHDNAVTTRERDTLLQENILLRKGGQHRQLESSERQLRMAKIQIFSLEAQISSLETQCSMLRLVLRDAEHGEHHRGATVPKHEIARQLRNLIRLCHPDKWADAAVATEFTKHLNALSAQYTE